MVAFRCLLLLACTLVSSVGGTSIQVDDELSVVSNPYHKDSSVMCETFLDTLLEPQHLILNPMPTQPDTFQDLFHVKFHGIPVPIFRMKQPSRLAETEWEFNLVLVKELGTLGAHRVHESPVPMKMAKDSWFLEYYWTPLVMECTESNFQHVGWKFTSVEANEFLPHFYALMVNIEKKNKIVEIRSGGFKAPGWMIEAITT